MPKNTVKVDRTNKIFGNPYKIGSHPGINTAADAVLAFKNMLWRTEDGARITALAKSELRGQNIACWCRADAPCHADVLLEIANA